MAQAAIAPGGSPLDEYLRAQAAVSTMPPTPGETAARGELDTNKGLMGELSAIRGRPQPQLQQQPLPQRPDLSIKQPSWEFMLAAVPMILMGSMKSRAPLTAALMAGGAALQGWNQGQMDVAHQKQEEWRDQLDLAIKQNQQELEAYRAAIEKNKGDMDATIAEIHAHAAAAGDQIALQQIQDGKIKDLFHMIEHREDMNMRLMEIREQISARLQAHSDAMAQTRELTEERMAETKRHNEEVEALAKARLNGAGQKSVDALDSALDQIGGIEGQLVAAGEKKSGTTLGVTGIGGWLNRQKETVTTLLGADSETPASDFQSALDTLKLELPKLLTGSSKSALDERAKIDTILRGLGPGDTAQKTWNAIQQVKGILERRKQLVLGGAGEADAGDAGGATEQPPVPGAVAGTYQGKPVWRAPDGALYAR